MKKKITYTDEPIGRVKVIPDFLPSPEELALKDETVKVTIALSKTSVDFFKKEAKKYNIEQTPQFGSPLVRKKHCNHFFNSTVYDWDKKYYTLSMILTISQPVVAMSFGKT